MNAFYLVGLAATLALSLQGCGGGSATTTTTSTKVPSTTSGTTVTSESTTTGTTPPGRPVGPVCQKMKFGDVQASLEKRYKNEYANDPSTPSYVKNGLMVHSFECTMSDVSIKCQEGPEYKFDDASLQWNAECGAAPPSGKTPTSKNEPIFCPMMGDWDNGKQAASFSYLRNDLLAQTIYSFGGSYVDVGFIIGDNAFKSVAPRCGYGGDANTNARNGGGCGVFGAKKATLDDPAAIYSASCQATIFKGKNQNQWAQAYQNVHGNCSIVFNNNAGAGSSDQTVQALMKELNDETANPFDDMFVAGTACQGNCPTGAVGCNEMLLPCCGSIEVSQPDSHAKNKNFPALADLDILAIFYVVRPNPTLSVDKKMKAAKFISEHLAKATKTDPVIVVGIDQDALTQHRVFDLFTCQDEAQASTGDVDGNTEIQL